jgi:P pilus assembly chaperone PapD
MSSIDLRHAGRAFACACLAVAALAGGRAAAAEFNLNPTRVELDKARSIETLVLGNADARPLSFEVSVKRWTMAADGSWQLQPSDDLVVHPLVFTVQPGAQARLRVGTLDPDTGAERAYRIELQQLPDAKADDGVAVALLTRVSVPVFVQTRAPQARAALEGGSLRADGLHLVLANTGDRYLPPQDARLRVLDADGRVLDESSVTTGYVLAGARLPLPVHAVTAAVCARAERVELQLPEAGGTVVAPLPAGDRQCGG